MGPFTGKRTRSGLCLLLGLASMSFAVHAQNGALKIPPVHGTVLAGQTVVLPQVLENKTGVLVIGFSQSSRDQVTAWGRRLGGDYLDSPKVTYYEIAMLAAVPKFLRGWVTRKIKEQVSPRGQAHFLPVSDHEDEWKKVAGFTNPDEAYVLLVDEAGQVLWTTQGPATDGSYAELKRRLQVQSRLQ